LRGLKGLKKNKKYISGTKKDKKNGENKIFSCNRPKIGRTRAGALEPEFLSHLNSKKEESFREETD